MKTSRLLASFAVLARASVDDSQDGDLLMMDIDLGFPSHFATKVNSTDILQMFAGEVSHVAKYTRFRPYILKAYTHPLLT